jgi:hypothetical protein
MPTERPADVLPKSSAAPASWPFARRQVRADVNGRLNRAAKYRVYWSGPDTQKSPVVTDPLISWSPERWKVAPPERESLLATFTSSRAVDLAG